MALNTIPLIDANLFFTMPWCCWCSKCVHLPIVCCPRCHSSSECRALLKLIMYVRVNLILLCQCKNESQYPRIANDNNISQCKNESQYARIASYNNLSFLLVFNELALPVDVSLSFLRGFRFYLFCLTDATVYTLVSLQVRHYKYKPCIVVFLNQKVYGCNRAPCNTQIKAKDHRY